MVLLFTVIVGGMVFGQTAQVRAQFVGTWVRLDRNETWVFGSDGKLTVNGTERKWAITGGYFYYITNYAYCYSYEMSSDGKTLILFGRWDDSYCLIKQ